MVSATFRHPEWWLDKVVGRLVSPSDAVVITGFWRSGTTWLQQALCRALNAKAILEPLRYSVEAYRPVLEEAGVANRAASFLDPYIPDAPPHFADRPELRRYIRNALTSSISGVPVRLPRFKIREQDRGRKWSRWEKSAQRIGQALRRGVVVKFTRAHLLLGDVKKEFGPRMIHLRRDPRAVVNSMNQIGWTWPSPFSLEDQLLGLGEERASVFAPWTDLIRRFDEQGAHVRVAGYWGIMEILAKQDVEAADIPVVKYRDVVQGGADWVQDQIGEMIDAQMKPRHLNPESWSSTAGKEGKSVQDRLEGWKEELNRRVIADIEGVITELEVEALV